MRRGKYIYYIRIYISANIVSISAPSAERIIISAIISNLSSSTGGAGGLCGFGFSCGFSGGFDIRSGGFGGGSGRFGDGLGRLHCLCSPPFIAARLCISLALAIALSRILASSFSVYAGIPISSRDPLSSAKGQ